MSVFAPSTCPRFLIADDHAMFAETLRAYLEKTYTVLGMVLDGHAMVAEAMRFRADVIVVDAPTNFFPLQNIDLAIVLRI
jgi:DNA-binding NarL/FixJ family response regulator